MAKLFILSRAWFSAQRSYSEVINFMLLKTRRKIMPSILPVLLKVLLHRKLKLQSPESRQYKRTWVLGSLILNNKEKYNYCKVNSLDGVDLSNQYGPLSASTFSSSGTNSSQSIVINYTKKKKKACQRSKHPSTQGRCVQCICMTWKNGRQVLTKGKSPQYIFLYFYISISPLE